MSSEFAIAPVLSSSSPLDVQGVDLGFSVEEIVSAVRETHIREGSRDLGKEEPATCNLFTA